MSTHSRHFMDEFGRLEAGVHWLSNGERRDEEFDTVSALLELGALDAGDRLRNGATPLVVITEDTDTQGLRTLLLSSGLSDEDYDVWSYASSSKLDSAKLLGRFILDTAPGTKVLVHRDRDYMTDEEVDVFTMELEALGLSVLVTTGTDVESHFLSPAYLHDVYPELSQPELAELIATATSEAREHSLKTMINAQTESANRAARRTGEKAPSPGTVAIETAAIYDESPERYRHGKKTLKQLKTLIQEGRGLNRAVLTTVSPHLAVESVRKLAEALAQEPGSEASAEEAPAEVLAQEAPLASP